MGIHAKRDATGLGNAGAVVAFRARRWGLAAALCGLWVSVAAPHGLAQGCTMCYTTAAAAGPAAARSLDLGILVLLIPTLVLFVGVLFYAFRRAAAT